MAHITALPVELLIIIFRLIYSYYHPENYMDKLLGNRRQRDITQPHVFPFNVAGTCRTWLALASSIPELWKNLVIFVGVRPTPLSTARLYFESASKDLHLRVTVTRREWDSDDASERARVAEITKILLPYVPRMKYLVYDVVHPSSLPSICDILHCEAPVLMDLHLRSRRKDIPLKPPVEVLRRHTWFQYPRLCNLTVDACNLGRASEFIQSWAERPSEHWKDFTLLNDSAEHQTGGIGYTARDALSLFDRADNLLYLRIDSVHFDPIDHAGEDFDFGRVNIDSLDAVELKNLSARDLYSVLDAVEWKSHYEEGLIAHCGVPKFISHFPGLWELHLEDLPDNADPIHLLRAWKGGALYVTNCPAFDDDVLAALSHGGMSDTEWLCPKMIWIRIYGCPRITPAALQELVAARSASLERRKARMWTSWPPLEAMESVSVGGCGITPDDNMRQWFAEHVDDFDWK